MPGDRGSDASGDAFLVPTGSFASRKCRRCFTLGCACLQPPCSRLFPCQQRPLRQLRGVLTSSYLMSPQLLVLSQLALLQRLLLLLPFAALFTTAVREPNAPVSPTP